MTVTGELNRHILEKIQYHQKLLNAALEVEAYLKCAKHNKEIKRLRSMLEPQEA